MWNYCPSVVSGPRCLPSRPPPLPRYLGVFKRKCEAVDACTNFPLAHASLGPINTVITPVNVHVEFCHRSQTFEKADNAINTLISLFSFHAEKAQHTVQLKWMVSQSDTELNMFICMRFVEFFWWLRKLRCGNLKDFGRKAISIFESTYIGEQTFSPIKSRDPQSGYKWQDEYSSAVSLVTTYIFIPNIGKLPMAASSAICRTDFVVADTFSRTFR